jgi:hypothetical protein
MPLAFVQSRSVDAGGSSSSALAFTSTVTAGSLLTMVFRIGTTTDTITGVSDDKGNTYTRAFYVSAPDPGNVSSHSVYYAMNAVAGATTVTVTLVDATASVRWAMHEYSGAATSAALDQVSGRENTTASTTVDTANVTTTLANELLFVSGTFFGATPSAGTNYTARESLATRLFTEDRIVSSTLTTNGAFTVSASITSTCAITTFKAFVVSGPLRSRGPSYAVRRAASY